jgi:hypothetical protein
MITLQSRDWSAKMFIWIEDAALEIEDILIRLHSRTGHAEASLEDARKSCKWKQHSYGGLGELSIKYKDVNAAGLRGDYLCVVCR